MKASRQRQRLDVTYISGRPNPCQEMETFLKKKERKLKLLRSLQRCEENELERWALLWLWSGQVRLARKLLGLG